MNIESNFNKKAEAEVGMTDAIAEIGALRAQALQGGAVDSETDELSRLLIAVRNEKIPPAEGVRLAREYMSRRQDYH